MSTIKCNWAKCDREVEFSCNCASINKHFCRKHCRHHCIISKGPHHPISLFYEPAEAQKKRSLAFLKKKNQKLRTLFSQISPATNEFNKKLKNIDISRNKTAEMLIKRINWELEIDFKATCSAYQTNTSLHDPPLIQANQDYLNPYQQKTSLYTFMEDLFSTAYLMIYNTSYERINFHKWQTLQQLNSVTCIAQLPNGKLFCLGSKTPHSGNTILIDMNGGAEVLPSGTPCRCSSCIYFNSSVYCFGWYDRIAINLASRFDLDQKRWIKLTPMPKADWFCNSIIFNGNILISGCKNRNLLLYSIDIDSFSTIPYEFAEDKRKLLANTDRLYLIECNGGSIYESEIGSDTNWRRIADSTITISSSLVYCLYNKGRIYIGESSVGYYAYYKFDLKEKRFITLEQYCVSI